MDGCLPLNVSSVFSAFRILGVKTSRQDRVPPKGSPGRPDSFSNRAVNTTPSEHVSIVACSIIGNGHPIWCLGPVYVVYRHV